MNEEKTQPAACPFCGSENAAPYSVKSCHSVLCVACGGEGPESYSEEGAITAWNRRASPSVNEEKTEAAGGVEGADAGRAVVQRYAQDPAYRQTMENLHSGTPSTPLEGEKR